MIMEQAEDKILKLPESVQSFEEIRNDGYIYVDKTDYVWKLANGKKCNFLGRPRRFGKSLFADTLKCYFEGRKDLFNGLKIMKLEHEWVKRQVFKFDFSGCETAEALLEKINIRLTEYEEIYGSNAKATLPGNRLLYLMEKACVKTGQMVAVIVDEYDAPLQHTLFKEEEHNKLVVVYRSFFPALKEGEKYLKCLFLTGITKFTSLSLFSTLNNVSILGHLSDYAEAIGLTGQEILDNFQPYLKAMAEKKGTTVEQVMSELKDMYDGYHFSDDSTKEIYNPFSVIHALADKDIANYWIASGASQLLNDLLKRKDMRGVDLDNCYLSKNELQLNDVSKTNTKLFLYQAGYLTINYFDDDAKRYYLRIPNKEVRETMFEIVLPYAVDYEENDVKGAIGRMQDALMADDIPELFENLKQLVSETPYITGIGDKNKLYERDFRFILRCSLYLCGCSIDEEKQTSKGRIDIVAHYKDIILLLELKLDNSGGLEAAKQQIIDNNYASAFSAENKKVYSVAISFNTESRSISGYEII